MSDYLPAPHGLSGFAAPVEQVYPSLTPFIELADGRQVVATDGADLIEPAADGRSLHVRWSRWAVVGSLSGKVEDVGITSDVVWRIAGNTLTREETLSSKQPVSISSWLLAVPTTHNETDLQMFKEPGVLRFTSLKGALDVRMSAANFQFTQSVTSTGDSALGRGVHGPIPLHLLFKASDLELKPAKPLKYKLELTVFE